MLIGMEPPPLVRSNGILLERERPLGDDRRVKSRARAVLAAACSIHFVHDGFSDILYVLLPIWANEFRLTFAQVGIIRTAYSGGMAAFQIPAGLLAERWGERGLVAAATILGVLSRLTRGMTEAVDRARSQEPVAASSGWGIRDPRGFQALTAIGMIDNATRTGFLTFLPFALIAKGSSVAGVGTALALLFAGGAVGKFACGLVAERLGVIRTVVLTEAATALGILALIPSPLPVALAILPLMGVALNGTSSVLYGTVADLVTAERRSRAYGLYYTLTIMSSALAPSFYGLIGDVAGVSTTLVGVSALVLTTIPLCLVLRASVAEPVRA